MKALLTCAVAFGVLFAVPAMAQWQEQGDAGDLPATAQIPIGSGALATIAGTCNANDVDMYCIHVDNPSTFIASMCSSTLNQWDTQLFLFRADGVGVKWDDDFCVTYALGSEVSNFTTCTLGGTWTPVAGNYLLAISKFNRDPLNSAGGAVFPSTSGCNTNAPSGVASWSGTTTAGGVYTISLTGVSYCGGATAVEPTTWGSIKNFYR